MFFKILNSIERNTLYNLNWLPGEIYYLQLNLNLCTPFLWHKLCIVGRRGTNHILTNIFRKLDKCILQFGQIKFATWRNILFAIKFEFTPFLWHKLCIVGRRGTNHILINIFRKLDKCILQFVNLLLAIWRSRIYPVLVHCWEERNEERWREGTCRFGSEPVAGA